MNKYKDIIDKINYFKNKYSDDRELITVLSKFEDLLEAKTSKKVYSRKILSLIFIGWLIGSALFFILGLYLFFPPYILFTYLHANATILQETLKAVYLNPRILSAADALFKLLGILMMIMSIVSIYQAHLLLGKIEVEES